MFTYGILNGQEKHIKSKTLVILVKINNNKKNGLTGQA